MPKPGPLGSSFNEVNSPAGSHANRPFLGPGTGISSSLHSFNISSTSSTVKSSWKIGE